MANTKIIIGNWKMNPGTSKEAEKLLSNVSKNLKGIKKTKVVVCVPFLYLEKLNKVSKKIYLGAQDAFYGETGAFTGEVSVDMLNNMGVKYVIVGHSERRALGEDNSLVNKKLKAALTAGLTPILCVGESSRDDKHEYFNFVKTQLLESLNGISKNLVIDIIVAYEPVWALSSTPDRRDATPADCREMIIFIKKVLSDKFGGESSKTKIIYGGSANEKDAAGFLTDGAADGLLPGKASLDPKKFSEMIKICETLSK